MGTRFLWAVVLVVSALALGARDAASQESDDAVRELIVQELEDGSVGVLLTMLDTEGIEVEGLDNTEFLCPVARAAAENAGKIAAKSKDKAKRFVEKLVELATSLGESDESADAKWALAHSKIAYGRVLRGVGEKVGAEPWIEAAVALEAAHGDEPDDGKPLATATTYVLEAAALEGADSESLFTHAETLAKKTAAAHPGSSHALTATVEVGLARARSVVKSKKADAVALIKAALKSLEPHVDGNPDKDLASAYNSLIDFGLTYNLKLREKHLTRTHHIVKQLEYDLPISKLWVRSGDGGETFITHLSPTGERLQTISFDWYEWTSSYTIAGGEAGGDNAKGIAKFTLQDWESVFSKVRKKKGPSKGKVGKKAPGGYVGYVDGQDEDGDDYAVRIYFFKSNEGNRRTYSMRIFEWDRKDSTKDPTVRALLDTLREIKR